MLSLMPNHVLRLLQFAVSLSNLEHLELSVQENIDLLNSWNFYAAIFRAEFCIDQGLTFG